MRTLIVGSAIIASIFPVLASATGSNPELSGLTTLVESVGELINTLIPIVIAAALLFFLWGLARFILASGDEEARKQGKTIMIWGLVALFVMVAVWGLVQFIAQVFDIEIGQDLNQTPGVNF